MTTCLNCDQAPEPGRVVCSIHSSEITPNRHNGVRTFVVSMLVTVIVGTIAFGCYVGTHLSLFSRALFLR